MVLLTLTAASGHARAHGGPPEAMAIVSAREGEPHLMLLNEGLAQRNGDDWSFVCPAAWGVEDTSAIAVPLAASGDAAGGWVVGRDDLYRIEVGAPEPQRRPTLSRSRVVALSATTEGVLSLGIDADGTTLQPIDVASDPATFRSDEIWSSMTIDAEGRIYLERTTDDPTVIVLTLDASGMEADRIEVALASRPARVSLRPSAHGLFAIMREGNEYLLARLSGTSAVPLARSFVSIGGPHSTPDGTLWVSVDDQLSELVGDVITPVAETRPVTCLGRWGDIHYACAGPEVFALDGTGLGERLFTVDGIAPPDTAAMTAQRASQCERQWTLFRGDLLMAGLAPAPASMASPTPPPGEPTPTTQDAAVPSPPANGGAAGEPSPSSPASPMTRSPSEAPAGGCGSCAAPAPNPSPASGAGLVLAGLAVLWRRVLSRH